MSIELRIPDLPTTVQGMQMLNTFTLGLAYAVIDEGFEVKLPVTPSDLVATARDGFDAMVCERTVRSLLEELIPVARRTLLRRGMRIETQRLDLAQCTLDEGTDADRIRLHPPTARPGVWLGLACGLRSPARAQEQS